MNLSVLWKPRRLKAAIRRRIDSRRTFIHAVQSGKKRFANDPNYRPDQIPQCFIQRPESNPDDSAIIKRIIAAYQKGKLKQSSAGEAFNVNNEWLPIYKYSLGSVMDALSNADVAAIQRMYRNFFRDPCSAGLVGLPINIPNLVTGGAIKRKYREYIMCDILHRYQLWRTRTGDQYPAAALSAPLIGNPYGYTVDDVFVRPGGDYQHYYSHAIGELLRNSASKVVAELGGGFGGMGFYLLRDHPQVTYVDFDLPETIALASYYLMRSLPDLPVRLYGEAEHSQEALQAPGAILLPSFEIMNMPSNSTAVSFNSYSLAEMSPASIKVYLDEIARITSGYILHLNHNRKSVLSADDFGIEKRGFKLMNRELGGWTLSVNPYSDEYEYLYKAEK